MGEANDQERAWKMLTRLLLALVVLGAVALVLGVLSVVGR